MRRAWSVRFRRAIRHGACAAGMFLVGLPMPQEHVRLLREKTEARLREIVASARGVMGVVVVDLVSGERFAINEDLVFPQGSAIKIPILMEVYKQAHEGRFRLTDRRRLEKAHVVGGSGILKEFGEGMSELSIYDLCVLMIVLSDNTATNMLIDLVGMENVNRTMASLGLARTRLQRKMIDPAASARGEENLSTPAEAARLMEILYRGEFINREVCDQILAVLKKPKRTAVSAGVPSGVPIASKPGSIPGVSTEWAIVDLRERPYIIVVMETYGMGEDTPATFREISQTVYDYFWRVGRATRYGTYVDPALLKR